MKWPVSKSISLLAIIGLSGLSLWARGILPDAPMATHFNSEGIADGFAPRDEALMIMPLTVAGVTLLLWLLPLIMPEKGRLERSAPVYAVAWIGTVLVLAFAHVFIVGHALGWVMDMRPALLAPGILLIFMGNFLPKTRYNYVLGVRTPWTLADERVWDKTHRFAGPVFMLAGAAMVIGGVLLPPAHLAVALLLPVLIASFVSVAASFMFSRQRARG